MKFEEMCLHDIGSGVDFNVSADKIMMLEAAKGGTYLYTRKLCIFCRKLFSAFVDELPPDVFCQCHRRYMVNMMYVTECNKTYAIVGGKYRAEISRRKRKQFIEKDIDFKINTNISS